MALFFFIHAQREIKATKRNFSLVKQHLCNLCFVVCFCHVITAQRAYKVLVLAVAVVTSATNRLVHTWYAHNLGADFHHPRTATHRPGTRRHHEYFMQWQTRETDCGSVHVRSNQNSAEKKTAEKELFTNKVEHFVFVGWKWLQSAFRMCALVCNACVCARVYDQSYAIEYS